SSRLTRYCILVRKCAGRDSLHNIYNEIAGAGKGIDILTRPGPDLSSEEREEVKKVARQLLQRLKTALVLNWRKKAQARAQVRLAIEDSLDEGLPRSYSPELYQRKCSAVFEH